jgi:hypothetical protein
MARRFDIRTVLHQPLMRAGKAIGAISIRRADVRPFTDRQIELLKTFADQAVIAIENARLFEEEQARTKELQESLEYQTAISEVLAVISRSPTDIQPVFEMIAQSAARLCNARSGNVFRFDGQPRAFCCLLRDAARNRGDPAAHNAHAAVARVCVQPTLAIASRRFPISARIPIIRIPRARL